MRKNSSDVYALSDIFDYILTRQKEKFLDIVREIIREEWYLVKWAQDWTPRSARKSTGDAFAEKHAALIRSLRADGFAVYEGEIMPISPEELEDNKRSLLTKLENVEFRVAKGHYNQAWENYVLGNWAAANAQLRTFLEALFDALALRLYPEEAKRSRPGGDRRRLLTNKGFIEKKRIP
jgi:hypothetical protein